ncbi:hypothetical protein GCK72_012837 [Caenorhabditis remanei]|uniref:PAN-3 domain-containing protein n=1 Tax=Caenorhabditis remanei TaxID=31234 RepID=A0A6A5GP15_CAERE|nr:hypothetical protein GCK72_012837 [Caenorhabditis remanei]KAF1756384.1 hypothetical protein GCK72_012837 [Caenorhabditis remanei]
MIVFWGRPVSFNNGNSSASTIISASSWTECVTSCWNSLYCVLAWSSIDSCVLYDFGTVLEGEKLDSSSNSKVAMKIGSTGSTCPSPSFELTSVEVVINDPLLEYTEFRYSIILASGRWSFLYNVKRSCPPTWTKFVRSTTEFCLKIIGSPDIFFTKLQLEALCVNSKGMLAGLESDEERNFATEEAHVINIQDTYLGNMFYISGDRKTTCSTWAQVQTPECAGLNAFSHSDKYLSTKSGYKWAPNNPDGVTVNGTTARCMILWSQKNETSVRGLVDDAPCGHKKTNYAAVRGGLCGRVAGV